MEKEPRKYTALNERLRTALFKWKTNNESPEAIAGIKSLIYEASGRGLGITFRITDEILNYHESSRAILPADLKKFARHEGKSFVFELGARRSSKPEFLLTARMFFGQPHLIFAGRHDGMIGIFRPNEIDSISAKVKV